MLVERKSMISGQVNILDLPITETDLNNYYNNHMLIQDAFPSLSPDEREFIKTGITPEEWNKLCGEE